jgi:glucose/mannose-6-phosphate isomerase
MEMRDLVANFTIQLKEALEIGSKVQLNPAGTISNVVISGLGGSGIGGSIVAELAFASSKVPVQITKGYFLPASVNSKTLVIVSSYSGNTEETLACMEQAMSVGARVIAITSGGKVAEIAVAKKMEHFIVPGGMPPRSCLGYSLTQLVYVFRHFGLLPADAVASIEQSVALLNEESASIKELAATTAKMLHGRIPVIYSTSDYEGVSVRFRQQLNENAKVLCWHHVIPEMNHNELVGWAGGSEEYAVILFRDPQEFDRNNLRIEINAEIIRKYTPHFLEVYAKGNSTIEKTMYLIHFGDWVSVELAALRGVDAVEVNVINFLKGELAKHQ